MRLLVPSKSAGSIIGKGGQNIQKLRTEFNANIRVPDCPGPERVMTIQADNPDVVCNVLEQTVPLLSEDSDSKEVRLLIHQSIVGGIIGRAGFKIKEIREASGANIKVYQTCAPQSTDRCVSINGQIDKIILALREVLDVVINTEPKGMETMYDPINFDGYYSHEYGGNLLKQRNKMTFVHSFATITQDTGLNRMFLDEAEAEEEVELEEAEKCVG